MTEAGRLPSPGLPQVGDLVDGKYRIESPLGRGGMGAVFRAVHSHTGRTVALKVIVPAYAADESFLRRFEREARAAGSLRHPNVVDVTDFGYATTERGRLAYLVMEFLDGCSLADVLRQQSGLPLAWSVDVLEQVGAAVEEAHRSGLLHRDLKPENIWLEPNRKGGYTVKVLDFGLAKLAGADAPEASARPRGEPAVVAPPAPASGDEEATRVRGAGQGGFDEDAPTTVKPDAYAQPELADATAAGAIVGTPAYMSPEQCLGRPLGPASDVYSLGVIAYRMLAGRLPFEGRPEEQLVAHVQAAPPELTATRRDLPPDAIELVMGALSKDPAARPQSAGAFAAMLSARVQPTSDFLRSALVLFLAHLRALLEISARWLAPVLMMGLLVAGLGVAGALGRWTPLELLSPIAIVLSVPLAGLFGILAVQGAIVPAVLQAVVAPLQPLDVRALRDRFRPRLATYLRGLAPLVAFLLAFFGWMLLVVLALPRLVEPFRPLLRTLPRGAVFPILLVPIFLLIVGPLLWFKTGRAGSAFQFLGAVAMIEGRSGREALERGALLARASGRALRPIRVVTMVIGFALGVGAGLASALVSGSGLPRWASAAVQSPFIALAMAVLAPFLSVVSALTYLRALKAAGESPDDVLRTFERDILPASHWKLATRERILTQIDATRG